jgi:hypothetical protein
MLQRVDRRRPGAPGPAAEPVEQESLSFVPAPAGAEEYLRRVRHSSAPRGAVSTLDYLHHGFRSARLRRALLHPWLHSAAPSGAEDRPRHCASGSWHGMLKAGWKVRGFGMIIARRFLRGGANGKRL